MIIALTNTKGGVGKSTLSVHLAVWLYDQGIQTALVDADRQRSAAEWIEEAEPDIARCSVESPDDCLQACQQLRDGGNVVVCDGPAGLDEVSRTILLLADLALLPISPSILDLRSVTLATAIVRYAQGINANRPQSALVLNKMRRRDRISRELARAMPELGLGMANSTIRDLQAFRDAAQQGTVVTRMSERSAHAARDDFEQFAVELFGDWIEEQQSTGAVCRGAG